MHTHVRYSFRPQAQLIEDYGIYKDSKDVDPVWSVLVISVKVTIRGDRDSGGVFADSR